VVKTRKGPYASHATSCSADSIIFELTAIASLTLSIIVPRPISFTSFHVTAAIVIAVFFLNQLKGSKGINVAVTRHVTSR
jgi:hypothetical protein